ncbi:MAG: GTPase Era [Ruminococcaceae bacterium]|nr:GTPase Era [Oscillospiraceae bacterium]
MNTRTAYIAIVGRPNVGKSTLLNALLGEKVAIVSNKPQTTRNRILGILTEGEDQYVFLDTPGVFTPRNALGEFMVRTAGASVGDSDVVILMVDASGRITSVEENIIENIKKAGIPSILAVNKTDLATPEEIAQCLKAYSEKHDFDAYVPLCAKNGKNTKALLSECEKFLVESEWLFPEDMMTDQPMRQVASEIIREKILRTMDKEIPHGVAVVIEEFKEEDTLVSIRAEIFCEKESHKGIIVGKGGEGLKRIGSYARADLEKMLEKKVYLNLWVKVKENWRESARAVGNFGYQED